MTGLSQDHPLSSGFLERYRLDTRRRYRASLQGAHSRRRRGQSLEFYEFTPFMSGDDIRHVDWRATARRGDEEEWLVRRFIAEEKLRLVLSLDMRESMRLPGIASKLQMAVWLAEAVAWITLRGGDEVLLHSLFAARGHAPVTVPRTAGRGRVRRTLQEFARSEQCDSPNVRALHPYLPPTAVWLILTDAYFGSDAGDAIARAIRAAEEGFRWVILVDLNSWDYEAAVLGRGPLRIEGPGLNTPLLRDVQDANLKQVDADIAAHKAAFLQRAGRENFDICWDWPADLTATSERFTELFRHRFRSEQVLRSLFRREDV